MTVLSQHDLLFLLSPPLYPGGSGDEQGDAVVHEELGVLGHAPEIRAGLTTFFTMAYIIGGACLPPAGTLVSQPAVLPITGGMEDITGLADSVLGFVSAVEKSSPFEQAISILSGLYGVLQMQ